MNTATAKWSDTDLRECKPDALRDSMVTGDSFEEGGLVRGSVNSADSV